MSDKNEQAPAAHDDSQLSDESLENVAGGLSKLASIDGGMIICTPPPPVFCPGDPISDPMSPPIILVEG